MILGLVIGLVLGIGGGLLLALLERTKREAVEVRLQDFQVMHAEASAKLEQSRSTDFDQMRGSFAELSLQALRENRDEFTKMAAPLVDTLARYEVSMKDIEKSRQDAYRELSITVGNLGKSNEQLQRETRALVTALRRPQTRGKWGEVQLRRVVEVAGMVEHCDFDVQVHISNEDAKLIPDMVVHMPGEAQIFVDAKVTLDAYSRLLDATNEEERELALKDHARQVRNHVDLLSKKEYWKHIEGSAEFVVIFIPLEPLLTAAFEKDPDLQEYAMANHVLLATPMLLIALLRTVAFAWRNETLASEAKRVQALGIELFSRLRTMGKHFGSVGSHLTKAVKEYNSAIASYERRVLVTARKFPEFGSGANELDEPSPIEISARPIADDEDDVLALDEPRTLD
jgi:DNA recombination protein RmuC